MATSFLTAADVADLVALKVDAFETRASLRGTIDLVLARWDPGTERYVARPAQRVIRRWATRPGQGVGTPQVIADASGQEQRVDGWFQAIAPFDVEDGDRFTLGATGSQETGVILRAFPAEMGIQQAAFRLTTGEQ